MSSSEQTRRNFASTPTDAIYFRTSSYLKVAPPPSTQMVDTCFACLLHEHKRRGKIRRVASVASQWYYTGWVAAGGLVHTRISTTVSHKFHVAKAPKHSSGTTHKESQCCLVVLSGQLPESGDRFAWSNPNKSF